FNSTLSLVMAAVLILSLPSATKNVHASPIAETSAPTLSTDTLDAAQKRANALTKIYGITSVQYALIQDGEIILTGTSGYKDKASKKVPTSDTTYGIASISKIFTTISVLKLVDEGKIRLDEPVIHYLPEFTMEDSRYKDITVRMLLNHSSGLMGSTSLNQSFLLGDTNTYGHDTFLKNLKKQRLKAAPGAFSVYSNDGFSLAELLIEKVSGVRFSEFIATHFTLPLGMTHTKTTSDTFSTSELAGIYHANGTKLPFESLCAIGAGGIYSTASDLCKLSTLFCEKTDFLSNASVHAMEEEEYKRGQWAPRNDSFFAYGLGWDSVHTYPFTDYNIKALSKGGDSIYYHSSLVVLPDENMAAAVVSSGGSSTHNQIFAQALLLDALKEKGVIPSIHPDKTFSAPVKTQVPDSLLGFAGYYGNFSSPIKVSIDKSGTLKAIIRSGKTPVTQLFIYNGEDRFYTPDGSSYLCFVEDKGNTYLYTSSYPSLPLLGQTLICGYQGQKLPANKISKEAEAAWSEFLNKDFYVVSEKYNSLNYIQGIGSSCLEVEKDLPNYVGSTPITDETSALASVQIPGMYGRDLVDLHLVTKDGAKYITGGGNVMVCQDSIRKLSTKKTWKITIPKSGYAQYFTIGNKSAGKKISVILPKKSSFTIYDKDGNMTFSSYVLGKSTATLPKGGTIVFAGSKKATFTVTYKG
ncbi:MAG: serine hydrolase domain-containing protein, partial [Lachnospiraceae bacterium]